MRVLRRVLFFLLIVPLVFLALVVGAWAVDLRRSDGEVMRNVTVGGTDVGGRSQQELRDDVAVLAARWAAVPFEIRTEGGSFTATLADLGLTVDEAATADAAMGLGRDGALPSRPFTWLRSLVGEEDAPVELAVDEPALREAIGRLDTTREPPTEPAIEVAGGQMVAVGGKAGEGIDGGDLVEALEDAVAEERTSVTVDRTSIEPRFSLGDAERLAARAEELASRQMSVAVGQAEALVPAETLRSWMQAEPADAGLLLRLDTEKVQADLEALFPEAGDPPKDASFNVEGDQVTIVPGASGTACCAENAGALVLEALETRTRPVRVPLRDVDPARSTEEAEKLGIVEKVGEFTTNFAAGQSRVTNIHRISDITRGVVIDPGGTFSVNEFVGERTREKGFVPAGVIYNGEFTEDVGGGISQYATTLFNAAFFAGLEFEEYQSHSIYISRYPYGREATLSFPSPDLKIKNPSPYGVLIWPTYTPSSVTISIYSTRWATGEQTAQFRSASGRCTSVRTVRTRTFTDGRTENDEVFARYRPSEGVNC